MSVIVQLDQFEGPLGLLLYLIRKEEMDIYDIPIAKITQQFLEYIRQMREFDLEKAGEFVAMAATLIQIKSKMLLPTYNDEGEVVETEDPRKELVQKLLEYQKFQEASKKLYERVLLGRDTFARGMKEELPEVEEEVEIEEGALFSLISMYRVAIKKLKKRVHTVFAKGQSIAARILEIKDRLVVGKRLEMHELLGPTEFTKNKILITFLSILELGRLGFISIFQSENYGQIHVELSKPIESDVVARVQEYETKEAEQVAEAWMAAAAAEKALTAVGGQEAMEQMNGMASAMIASANNSVAGEGESMMELEMGSGINSEMVSQTVSQKTPNVETHSPEAVASEGVGFENAGLGGAGLESAALEGANLQGNAVASGTAEAKFIEENLFVQNDFSSDEEFEAELLKAENEMALSETGESVPPVEFSLDGLDFIKGEPLAEEKNQSSEFTESGDAKV